MKKLLSIFLLILILSLMTSCGGKGNKGDKGKDEGVHVHSYGDWVTLVEASCTNEGLRERFCPCGEREECVVPVLSHIYENYYIVKPANCIETGLKTAKCNYCDSTDTEVIKKNESHTRETVTGYAATCTENGLTDGVKCTTCGKTLEEQTVIEAKGHVEVYDSPKDATCTQTGLSWGSHCGVCGFVFVEQVEFAANGHKVEVLPAVDATCTEDGLTQGEKCTVCGEVTVAQQVVDATGHSEYTIPGIEATCTRGGLTDGVGCRVCNQILVPQNATPIVSHTYDDIYDESCNVCGFIRDAECAHNDVIVNMAVAPGCTTSGLTRGEICAKCGEILIAQTVIEPTGHSSETVSGKAPTCTETGLTSGTKCSNCGVSLKDQEIIEPKGHNEQILEGYESTCTEEGLSDGSACADCGEILVHQSVLPKANHVEEIIPGVEATCTESGYTESGYCTVCGEVTQNQVYIPAKGHTEKTLDSKEPTCTQFGLTEGVKCEVCDKIIVEQTIIPANGHTEVIIPAIKPTCVETGLTEGKNCSVCGEIIIAQEILKAEHSVVVDNPVAATCKSTGLTEGKHCSACGQVILAQQIIPISDCTAGEWQAEKEVTKTQDGNYRSTCVICGKEMTRYLHATGSVGLEFSLNDDGTSYTVIGIGDCTDNHLVIPSYYNDLPVTEIGEAAFGLGQSFQIVTVNILSGVTTIGSRAFDRCHMLTGIIIPDSVTYIGNGAFSGSYSLIEVCNKSSLTNIYPGSWAHGNIAEYAKGVITDESESKLKYIDDYIFYDDGSTVYLVKYLNTKESVTLPAYNGSYDYEIYRYAFTYCNRLNSIVIPEGVTKIGNWAFSYCYDLELVTIPDSVSNVGGLAFYLCGDAVEVEMGVSYVDKWAVGCDDSVANISLRSNTVGIANSAFSECESLVSIDLPESLKYIGDTAFGYCTLLTSVIIPKDVKSIGKFTFEYCISLTSVVVGEGVTDIEEMAFSACYSLIEIVNKSSLDLTLGCNNYGEIAYYAKHIITDESESYLKYVDNYIFFDTGTSVYFVKCIGAPTDVVLPEYNGGEKYKIYKYAFFDCQTITSISIPDCVTEIDKQAFSFCNNIFESDGGVLYIDNWAIGYEGAPTEIILREGTVGIADFAFVSCSSLTSVELPNSVKYIGEAAFMGCDSMVNVVIGNGVEVIDYSAFFGCHSFTDVYYVGSSEEWADIKIALDNDYLVNANIEYNYVKSN